MYYREPALSIEHHTLVKPAVDQTTVTSAMRDTSLLTVRTGGTSGPSTWPGHRPPRKGRRCRDTTCCTIEVSQGIAVEYRALRKKKAYRDGIPAAPFLATVSSVLKNFEPKS